MDIKPVFIFSGLQGVRGWFTNKNVESVNTGGVIPGLNCGLKTAASEEETRRNRKDLYRLLKLDSGQVALADQVHGSRVTEVTEGGVYADSDALITTEPGMTLAIQVADCVAVLVADPAGGVIGAAHAGWRGAADGVIGNTVRKMVEKGSGDMNHFHAYISPAISVQHYEVGEEVAGRFPDAYVERKRYSKPHLDLKGFVRNELREAGVPDYQIETDSGCTFSDSSRFYSWRREKEQAGRMLAMIRWQPTMEKA